MCFSISVSEDSRPRRSANAVPVPNRVENREPTWPRTERLEHGEFLLGPTVPVEPVLAFGSPVRLGTDGRVLNVPQEAVAIDHEDRGRYDEPVREGEPGRGGDRDDGDVVVRRRGDDVDEAARFAGGGWPVSAGPVLAGARERDLQDDLLVHAPGYIRTAKAPRWGPCGSSRCHRRRR